MHGYPHRGRKGRSCPSTLFSQYECFIITYKNKIICAALSEIFLLCPLPVYISASALLYSNNRTI